MPSNETTAVLVQFIGTDAARAPDIAERHRAAAERHIGVPGLISKTNLVDPSTDTVGGFYVFETEEQARALFASDWWREATARNGVSPTFRYFSVTAMLTPEGLLDTKAAVA